MPRREGQTLIMFVFFLVVLIVFIGLGIDIGFAYITKAQLSKAVDAAALDGMKNLSQGTLTAGSIATATFRANYGQPGRDTGTITPTFTWGGSTSLTVNASVTINTFFIRVLPTWKTLTVSANAQSARQPLIMSLVLDWSGSMFTAPPSGSGGALNGNLTTAVDSFINYFDNNNDRVAMAVFGSSAELKVPMEYQFKSPVITAEQSLANLGRTFSDGGLTIGLQQIQGVTLNPGESVLKVIVFFTDGFANTFQASFGNCGTLNLGQDDPFSSGCSPGQCVAWMTTSGGSASCSSNSFLSIGGTVGNDSGTVTTVSPGAVRTIASNNQNVWIEAQLRALATANAARNANILVYSIGLGNSSTTINHTLLLQIANADDPSNPTFNSNQPIGEAIFAPTAADLQTAFEQIAAKILLRLSQ